MKKVSYLILLICSSVALFSEPVWAAAINLRAGDQVNRTTTQPDVTISATAISYYSTQIVGKPSFIIFDTQSVVLVSDPILPSWDAKIEYSIKALSSATAGIYNFSVKFTLGPVPASFTLYFTVGIDVPDVSISPSKFLPFGITKYFDSPDSSYSSDVLAFDGTYLWHAASYKIHKLDTSGNILDSFDSPGYGIRLAFVGKNLWCADASKIYKLDSSGGIIQSFNTPAYCYSLAFDGMYLWCASLSKIYKLDTSGNILSSFDAPSYADKALDFDGTYLWCMTSTKIYKLDTSGNIAATFDTPDYSFNGLAFDGAYLWCADKGAQKIYQLEIPYVGTEIRQTFTIKNDGYAELAIDSISITGDNSSEFRIQNDICSLQSIAPSQFCTFDIVFTPITEGDKTAQIEIASNDPRNPVFSVPITVTVSDMDADDDGINDFDDNCPNEFNPGQEDGDGDGYGDACDACPNDLSKVSPGACGCGVADTDTDGDGTPDCDDPCPNDRYNDADNDGFCGDIDNCRTVYNPDQEDTDGDGTGNACDIPSDTNCLSKKLKASSAFCKAVISCLLKELKRPNSEALYLRLDKAESKFFSAWGKASVKTGKKGMDCSTPATSQEIMDNLNNVIQNIALDIEAGVNNDNKLSSSLIKSAGICCRSLLNAESANTRKANSGKKTIAQNKAIDKFKKSWEKALSKKGSSYSGPQMNEVLNMINDLVNDVLSGMGTE